MYVYKLFSSIELRDWIVTAIKNLIPI